LPAAVSFSSRRDKSNAREVQKYRGAGFSVIQPDASNRDRDRAAISRGALERPIDWRATSWWTMNYSVPPPAGEIDFLRNSTVSSISTIRLIIIHRGDTIARRITGMIPSIMNRLDE